MILGGFYRCESGRLCPLHAIPSLPSLAGAISSNVLLSTVTLMITLETLSQATEQEVFDQVAEHLLAQGTRSQRGSQDQRCQYHWQHLKCAAGCLISDKEYYPGMEDNSWATLVSLGVVPEDHKSLIVRLQSVHDNVAVEYWKQSLKLVAKNYSLTFNH